MGKDDRYNRSRDAGADADEDLRAFRRAVAGARPLAKPAVVEPERRHIPARARFTRADEQAVIGESLGAPSDGIEGDSWEQLRFRRNGIGHRTFRKLARGRFSVGDVCDLHGLTVDEARAELQGFLETALARRLTCVRIIHGKGMGSGRGGPILKRKVDVWLRQWDAVLAFVSARPTDGGTGAVYVLLKRS